MPFNKKKNTDSESGSISSLEKTTSNEKPAISVKGQKKMKKEFGKEQEKLENIEKDIEKQKEKLENMEKNAEKQKEKLEKIQKSLHDSQEQEQGSTNVPSTSGSQAETKDDNVNGATQVKENQEEAKSTTDESEVSENRKYSADSLEEPSEIQQKLQAQNNTQEQDSSRAPSTLPSSLTSVSDLSEDSQDLSVMPLGSRQQNYPIDSNGLLNPNLQSEDAERALNSAAAGNGIMSPVGGSSNGPNDIDMQMALFDMAKNEAKSDNINTPDRPESENVEDQNPDRDMREQVEVPEAPEAINNGMSICSKIVIGAGIAAGVGAAIVMVNKIVASFKADSSQEEIPASSEVVVVGAIPQMEE